MAVRPRAPVAPASKERLEKLDELAKAALMGICVREAVQEWDLHCPGIASEAYDLAEAMLLERKKRYGI